MKDNTDIAERTGVEALFGRLQVSLRKEAEKRLPALAPRFSGTETFAEPSLEQLYFAGPAGILPRGSVVLILPGSGGTEP